MKLIKKNMTLLAMLTALTVVLARLFIFPVPVTKGYVNFLEVGIYVSAMLLGGPAGAVVGGISGGILDLILGYPQWLPFSAVIHGTQGYVAGRFLNGTSFKKRVVYLLLASLVMVVGYFFATWLLYGWVAAVASIIGNVIQNSFGLIVSLFLMKHLDKLKLIK